MDRAKILDKIKKCLALSKSPNEHEAAAALRQAQKLMARNGVTESELNGVGYGHEKVDTSVQVGKRRKLPVTMSAIIHLMAHAFGVKPVVSAEVRESDYNWSITYYGPEHRVALAVYAHTVVARAVEAAWADYLTVNPQYRKRSGGRAGFYLGWIKAVREHVEEFGMTDEERAGTEFVIQKHTGGGLVKSAVSNQSYYSGAAAAGAEAGADFRLHRPVNMERKRLENK